MKNCLDCPGRFSRWHLPAPRSSQLNCTGQLGFEGTQPLHHWHISIPWDLHNAPAMLPAYRDTCHLKTSPWAATTLQKRMAGTDLCVWVQTHGSVCLVMQPNLPRSKCNPSSSTCFGVLEQKFNTNLITPRFLTVVRSSEVSQKGLILIDCFPLICFPVAAPITSLLNGQELHSPQQLKPFLFSFLSHVTCHAVIITFQSSSLCTCFLFLALFSTQ